MVRITILIAETNKELDHKKYHEIYESLHEYAVTMEIEKIKSRITFEKKED